MKATPEMLAAVRAAFASLYQKYPAAWEEACKRGYSSDRFRWDAARAAGVDIGQFYRAGMNDEHIDTLLRRSLPAAWTKS